MPTLTEKTRIVRVPFWTQLDGRKDLTLVEFTGRLQDYPHLWDYYTRECLGEYSWDAAQRIFNAGQPVT